MKHIEETERKFALHTIESAPERSKKAMEWYQRNFQMIPNLTKLMSASPALLNSYWETQLNILEQGSLSAEEVNIVETVIAHENKCQYCVAGHTAFSKNPIFKNKEEDIEAIRNDKAFTDEKLNSLRDFSLAVLKHKGRVSDEEFEAFIKAGYTRAQALDIVTCIAAKVMSNFANQIALTPIDDAFAPLAEGLAYKEERKILTIKS
ncbi:MAG: carboxymuconolactone decarboxylase family protein [Candidatus Caenarcaniphilales bacterium]|nr:carboxymuconolactone decarboxylase family protein [Candidatus Caenarcaniphilales bacterium]